MHPAADVRRGPGRVGLALLVQEDRDQPPVARIEVQVALRLVVEVRLLEDERHAQYALPEVDRRPPVGPDGLDVVDALALELPHLRVLPDEARPGDHGLELLERQSPRQVLHPAVGSDGDPLRRHDGDARRMRAATRSGVSASVEPRLRTPRMIALSFTPLSTSGSRSGCAASRGSRRRAAVQLARSKWPDVRPNDVGEPKHVWSTVSPSYLFQRPVDRLERVGARRLGRLEVPARRSGRRPRLRP